MIILRKIKLLHPSEVDTLPSYGYPVFLRLLIPDKYEMAL
jgi:hypothetical protein